jgi:hypothetical protein
VINIIISYIAGSGGEIFASPLVSTGIWRSPVLSHELDQTGRMLATLDTRFTDAFEFQPHKHFYCRDWHDDFDKLSAFEPWLMPVTDQDQSKFLKDQNPHNVFLITINYQESASQFVLDSFCRKILDQPNYLTRDSIGQHFLATAGKTEAQQKWLIDCGRDGLLGQWYRDMYQTGTLNFPPPSHNIPGDLEINVTDLFDWQKLQSIYVQLTQKLEFDLDLELVKSRHHAWLMRQPRLTNNS